MDEIAGASLSAGDSCRTGISIRKRRSFSGKEITLAGNIPLYEQTEKKKQTTGLTAHFYTGEADEEASFVTGDEYRAYAMDPLTDIRITHKGVVKTDSMEPTIHARNFILAVPVWTEDVREGDIVVYWRPAPRFLAFSVVHRVIRIEDDRSTFIFRGDHEKEEDPPVSADQIRYRVIYP